jgi:preprotein translocase subunit SecG
MGLILVIHAIICILLIGIILIQAGRGSGLVESFSNVESMFGPKTNVFLTRATAVLSTLFFITCLGLAVLSARQGRSLLRDAKTAGGSALTNETQGSSNLSSQTQTLPEASGPEASQQDTPKPETPKSE